ncbi:MAG: YihY/virulence factor BrkB family protein [Corynebacteriales bacterium]|uniref:YihY/virulence factor BrkB family protein n=1 Tax=Williamsia herbipolensis TaxID=1603258 RepID=A0AAU4K2D7_9NOCA|nr:YihY/virulence factor BrkB family protein [Williamsia herbipolensis]MCX6471512.1 YihY/virulence factor BrkB family protein [Mycobacteriales bacterium]
MGVFKRLDALQRRNRGVGFVFAVIYKFVDDQGGYLAALVTYYAFLSLFPLLLLSTTILGFLLAGDPGLQERLLNSALGEFPIIGDQLGEPRRLGGGSTGVVIGVIGALYGASGIGQATQNAMNTVWAVPRNSRPNPFLARIRSVRLLLVLVVALAGTTTLSLLGNIFDSFGSVWTAVSVVGAVVINAVVFAYGYRIGTSRDLAMRQVLPGAAVMAVVWQLLQTFGAYYVERVVRNASATNSVFAVVLGLMAFLYLTAISVVFTAEINSVRVDKLYPRALLTPFTDDVVLTRGDRRAYTNQAKAQRAKGFEQIDVTFDKRPPPEDPDDDPRG